MNPPIQGARSCPVSPAQSGHPARMTWVHRTPESRGSRKEEPRPAMRPGKWVSPNLGHKVTWIRGVGLRIVAIVDRNVLVRGDRAVWQNIVIHLCLLCIPCNKDSLNPGCGDSRSSPGSGIQCFKVPGLSTGSGEKRQPPRRGRREAGVARAATPARRRRSRAVRSPA